MTRKEGVANSLLTSGLLVLAGMFVIGLIDNFVVQIAQHAGLWQFHFTRTLMAVPVLAGICFWRGVSLWPKRAGRVFWRSMFMTISMLLYFAALPLMQISAVVAGLFTAPAFVLIFSVLFFGERIGWVRVVAVIIGFFGVLLVAGTGADALSWSLAIPVLAGVFYALNTLTLRHWCAGEDTVVLLIWFFMGLGLAGLVGVLILNGKMDVAFGFRGWISPSLVFLAWCAVQAYGSMIAVGCLTRAYQSTDPSYLAVLEYSLLIFASFWAWMLFGQTIGFAAVLGILLIIASGAFIALRSRAVEK
jgi:drug/metabolite transporter (DMT)-like permease